MSQKELEAVRTELSALRQEDVAEPWAPPAVILQEANDLWVFAREARVRERLFAVGLAATSIDRLGLAVGAARAAQSQWTVTRDRSKSAAQKELETRGIELRRELIAAVRWSLRGDTAAIATLNVIADGEGLADLVQDLSDLAQLIERNAAAFAGDSTFDANASERARALSSELAAGMSTEQLDETQLQAKQLRNRALTHLDGLVAEIREAGRYAFRGEELAKRFYSDYMKRKRAAAKRRERAEPPAAPAG